MKTHHAVMLAMTVGFGLGAGVVQGLHAQATPPAFYIAENNVSNLDAYMKEFSAKTTPLTKAAGGRFLTQGGKVTPLAGEPPNPRVIIQQWDSMEKLLAWYKSPKNTELQKIAAKYATIRAFAVVGVPQ